MKYKYLRYDEVILFSSYIRNYILYFSHLELIRMKLVEIDVNWWIDRLPILQLAFLGIDIDTDNMWIPFVICTDDTSYLC